MWKENPAGTEVGVMKNWRYQGVQMYAAQDRDMIRRNNGENRVADWMSRWLTLPQFEVSFGGYPRLRLLLIQGRSDGPETRRYP